MKQNLVLIFLHIAFISSAQNPSSIEGIHCEINKINSMELRKIRVLNEDECGIIEYAIYMDEKMNIRKVQHSYTEGCAVEDGFSYTEYFSEKGNLIFHFFSILSTYEPLLGYYKGSFYYQNGNLIKKDIKNSFYPVLEEDELNIDSAINTFPIIFKNQRSHQYCLHKTIAEVNKHLRVVKRINFNEFNFEELLVVNNNNVLLREKPSTNSKVLTKLDAYTHVYYIEKSEKESIKGWGSHQWYKVRYTHDQPEPIIGWIFGAFIDRPIQDLTDY